MPIFTSDDPAKAYANCVSAANFRVKWKDIFNVKEFYRAIHEWLSEYGWTDMEDGQDYYETLYFERIGMGGDKEIWLRWRPQKKINSYYKYHLDLDYHFLYLLPTEVVREGKKFKKNVYKGEVEVKITALIELDHENQWENHPILKYLNKLFQERIFRGQIKTDHKLELYREAYLLQNYIKQWFKLKTNLPYAQEELFFPSEAYPTYGGGGSE